MSVQDDRSSDIDQIGAKRNEAAHRAGLASTDLAPGGRSTSTPSW